MAITPPALPSAVTNVMSKNAPTYPPPTPCAANSQVPPAKKCNQANKLKYKRIMPNKRSVESSGNCSTLRITSQRPRMINATGSTNVPQPAIFLRVSIHIPVNVPFSAEIRLSRVKKPTNARTIPKISSFRSLERAFHEKEGCEVRLRCCTVRPFLAAGALFLPLDRVAGLRDD